MPSPEELALLEPLSDQLPPEVFTTEYTNPVNDNAAEPAQESARGFPASGPGRMEGHAGRQQVASQERQGRKLNVEFLLDSPLFERIALPYQQQLELLGIGVTIKTVDSAQYERQVQTFDYDIIVGSWGQSLSPGNEQRDFWGSEAAKRNGSRNYVGIDDPAIDKLIEAIIFAPRPAGLITACKALDRALIWNHYVVPMWYVPTMSAPPAGTVSAGLTNCRPTAVGFPSIWWWDEERAGKVAAKDEAVARGRRPLRCCFPPRPWQRRSTASRSSATSSIPPISSHFDYVNPDAPKGGKMALIGVVASDTFDSFNGYILKGDRGPGLELMFDTLMARAMDEPDAIYGLVAKSADLAA